MNALTAEHLVRNYLHRYGRVTLQELLENIPGFKEESPRFVPSLLRDMMEEEQIDRTLENGVYYYYSTDFYFNWRYLLLALAIWSMRFKPFAILSFIKSLI